MLLLTFKTFKLIEKDGSKRIAILRAKLDQLRDLHVVNRIKANFLKIFIFKNPNALACWRRSVGTREYLGVKSHIVPCLCMTPVRCGEGAGKEDGQSRDTQTFLHVCFHYLPPAQQYIYCQTVQTSEGILTIKSCEVVSLACYISTERFCHRKSCDVRGAVRGQRM